MRWRLFFVLLVLAIPRAGCCGGSVQGLILDPIGLAVSDANVQIAGLDRGTASRSDGYFILRDLPAGDHTLSISHIRYQPVTASVRVIEGGKISVQVRFVEQRELSLDEIVVTALRDPVWAEKSPQPVARISPQEIKRRYQYNAGEMLDWVPGVRLIRAGATVGADYGLSIRSLNGGSASNKTLVLIDGRPVNNGWDGGINFNMIPQELIHRIEIVKGASSALYGSQATAGVINILTRSAPRGWHGWISMAHEFSAAEDIEQSGRDGYGRPEIAAYNVQMSGSYGGERCRHLMTLGYRRSENSFPTLAQNRWNDYDLNYKVGSSIKENLALRFSIDMHHNEWDNSAERVPMKEKYTFFGSDLRVDVMTGRGSLDSRIYLNYSADREHSLQSDMKAGFANYCLGLMSDYSLPLIRERASLRVGIDAAIDRAVVDVERVVRDLDYLGQESIAVRDNRTGRVTNRTVDLYSGRYGETQQTESLANLALYGQYQHQLNDRLNAVLGGRLDRQSQFGTIFNPKLGFSFELLRRWNYRTNLKMNYGTGFRAPTMIDLFSKSLNGYGDPGIEPERTENFDIGLYHRIIDRGYLEISYFRMNVDNLIINDKLGSTGWGYYAVIPHQDAFSDTLSFNQRMNRGDYSPQGLELGCKIVLHPQLTLQGAYTYLDPQDFTFQTSAHRYNAGLYAWSEIAGVRFDLEVRHSYTGDGYFFDYGNNPFPAYSLTNVSLGFDLRNYRLSLHLRNAGDTRYRHWHHTWQPGRTIALRWESRF